MSLKSDGGDQGRLSTYHLNHKMASSISRAFRRANWEESTNRRGHFVRDQHICILESIFQYQKVSEGCVPANAQCATIDNTSCYALLWAFTGACT
jgi:hypothetical protein